MANILKQSSTKIAVLLSAVALMSTLVYAESDKSLLVDDQIDNQVVPASADEAPALIAPSNSVPSEPLPPPSRPSAQVEAGAEKAEPKKPFLRPTEPRRIPVRTALSVKEESMPAPDPAQIVEEPALEVRPAPPIAYDTDRDARRMYRASGEVNVTMIARNPADGCLYEIPMCIPACCVGEPKVDAGRGLFGRGVVEFCWECGFTAKVKFRQVRGDVKVEYEGE